MVNVCGIICEKSGFSATVIALGEATDHEFIVPPAYVEDRAAALSWLATEAQRFFDEHVVSDVRLWTSPSGGKFSASAERNETEACVKIAAHRAKASI